MYIPHRQAEALRQAEGVLFYRTEGTKTDRIRVFWKLMRPILEWVKKDMLQNTELTPAEAESEIYLFCADLFAGFDPDRSSIIPYLARFTGHYKAKLDRKLARYANPDVPVGLLRAKDEPYEMYDECYLSTPGILFENRYIGKLFTMSEKCTINRILAADDMELDKTYLAKQCAVSRNTMSTNLAEIATILEEAYGTAKHHKLHE